MSQSITLIAAVAVAAGASLSAEPPAVPPTPGSVLLLAERAEPDAHRELMNALLSDDDADTRAVAARAEGRSIFQTS